MVMGAEITSIPAAPNNETGWPWGNNSASIIRDVKGLSNLPKISIVTPSYNQADYLEETIRSVLLQEYPNLEYFVIDGGSTDGSVEVIRKYEPWLTIWVSEKDRGQSDAINKGFKRATGEIRAWLNSDDYLLPGTLRRVADLFRIYPEAGLIHAKAFFIDEQGKDIGSTYGGVFDLRESLIESKNPVAQPAAFFTEEAWRHTGGLDEDLHMSMDWDLWLRIGVKYPTYFIDEAWAAFRLWHGAKGSNIAETSSPEHLKAVKKLIFRNKSKTMSLRLKRQALAAGYARDAIYRFTQKEYGKCKKHILLSIILSPSIGTRLGRDVIPVILFGESPAKKLANIKQRIRQRG